MNDSGFAVRMSTVPRMLRFALITFTLSVIGSVAVAASPAVTASNSLEPAFRLVREAVEKGDPDAFADPKKPEVYFPPPESQGGWRKVEKSEDIRLLAGMDPDNLAGLKTPAFVQWCWERGILLLSTPLGGSWLHMAESIQRIISRRALAGQHPQSAQEVMTWLAATVRGWNATPTPFVWGGKRQQRRWRARHRRHALAGSGAVAAQPLRHRSRLQPLPQPACA